MKHSVLAEKFAAGATNGTGSRMFIEGDMIYSHGRHFPIAKRIGYGEYLFNSNGYSMSTQTHKGHVWRALYPRAQIWEAPHCEVNRIPSWLLERVNRLHENILGARSRLSHYVHELEDIQKYWENCKKKFGKELKGYSFAHEKLEFALMFKNKDEVKAKIVAQKFEEATRRAA